MYSMAKSLKETDMSESKIFPNRSFITMKEQKAKKIIRNLQESVIVDYVNLYVITVV